MGTATTTLREMVLPANGASPDDTPRPHQEDQMTRTVRTSRRLAVAVSVLALTVGGAASAIAAGSPATARHGADDPASHDRFDDKGGLRGGHGADDSSPSASATSSSPSAKASTKSSKAASTSSSRKATSSASGDDHGRRHGGHGADDSASHDANDDHGRRHGGHGSDD